VSVKAAPWQKPWLLESHTLGAFHQAQVTGVMWRLAQRNPFRRAIILFGVDQGYWREERLLERELSWWATTDSHREPPVERDVSRIGRELEQLCDRIQHICTQPPPGSLIPHPGWVGENEQAQAEAVPVLLYPYGGRAMVARGFELDRALWGLLEQAKTPSHEPPP